MLKTNVIGSVIICLILFTILGYVFSLGVHINWPMYFKVAGIIVVIAAIIGIAAIGGDKT
jgi:hypothetical protein